MNDLGQLLAVIIFSFICGAVVGYQICGWVISNPGIP